MTIDHYGEVLVGCIDCNRWGHPGDDKLIMELMESDLEALRGLTGSGTTPVRSFLTSASVGALSARAAGVIGPSGRLTTLHWGQPSTATLRCAVIRAYTPIT